VNIGLYMALRWSFPKDGELQDMLSLILPHPIGCGNKSWPA